MKIDFITWSPLKTVKKNTIIKILKLKYKDKNKNQIKKLLLVI